MNLVFDDITPVRHRRTRPGTLHVLLPKLKAICRQPRRTDSQLLAPARAALDA